MYSPDLIDQGIARFCGQEIELFEICIDTAQQTHGVRGGHVAHTTNNEVYEYGDSLLKSTVCTLDENNRTDYRGVYSQEQQPGRLLRVIQLGGASRFFPEDVIYVFEGLFKHRFAFSVL